MFHKKTLKSFGGILILSLVVLSAVGCTTPRPTAQNHTHKHVLLEQPWSVTEKYPEIKEAPQKAWKRKRTKAHARSGIVELAFKFYSNHLTKVDGARCEHRPTCSRYGIESMRKHGFVVGSWLTIDRLMRAGRSSSLRSLPLKLYHGGLPYYADPVEENDFFF